MSPLVRLALQVWCSLLKGRQWKQEERNRRHLSEKRWYLVLTALKDEKPTICISLHVQQTVGTRERCSVYLHVAIALGQGTCFFLFALPLATHQSSRCCMFVAIYSAIAVAGMWWLTNDSCCTDVIWLWKHLIPSQLSFQPHQRFSLDMLSLDPFTETVVLTGSGIMKHLSLKTDGHFGRKILAKKGEMIRTWETNKGMVQYILCASKLFCALKLF